MSKRPTKAQKKEVGTTGHSWDGIEEYNNPMPRWWLWTFYITIAWGVIYTILFPAWPLINGATPGILGQSSRGDVAAEIMRFEEANGDIEARLVSTDLTEISADPDLQSFAHNSGAAVFRTRCAQCHGSGAAGAAGAKGYPNLLDDDWLWGGSIEDIYLTVAHGIRNDNDPDARWSEMPKFGELLEDEEIDGLVQYVLSISGQEHDEAIAMAASETYLDQCSSCHMEDGTGDREVGAPNLTDSIWLFGGDPDSIRHTITYARFGVMPNWSTQLSESQIRAVASYVHSLGGGE